MHSYDTDSMLNLSSLTCRVCAKKTITSILSYFPISHKKFVYRSLPTLPPSFTSGTRPNNELSYPSLPAVSKYKCNSLGSTKWRVSPINCVLKHFRRAYITPVLYCIICELVSPNARDLCPTNSSMVLIGHASCSAEASAQLDVVLC